MLAAPASAAAGPAPAERSRGSRGAGRGARGPGRGAGGDALVTPMQGTIVKIVAGEGTVVKAGDTVVILEAMKMEQPLTAHKDGTVTGLAVEVGQTVSADTEICQIKE
jgi:acetyl-CoA/propionyl-CoA carboxylase, biotin carboxylase, biotin carboxyl carrier protein